MNNQKSKCKANVCLHSFVSQRGLDNVENNQAHGQSKHGERRSNVTYDLLCLKVYIENIVKRYID